MRDRVSNRVGPEVSNAFGDPAAEVVNLAPWDAPFRRMTHPAPTSVSVSLTSKVAITVWPAPTARLTRVTVITSVGSRSTCWGPTWNSKVYLPAHAANSTFRAMVAASSPDIAWEGRG